MSLQVESLRARAADLASEQAQLRETLSTLRAVPEEIVGNGQQQEEEEDGCADRQDLLANADRVLRRLDGLHISVQAR